MLPQRLSFLGGCVWEPKNYERFHSVPHQPKLVSSSAGFRYFGAAVSLACVDPPWPKLGQAAPVHWLLTKVQTSPFSSSLRSTSSIKKRGLCTSTSSQATFFGVRSSSPTGSGSRRPPVCRICHEALPAPRTLKLRRGSRRSLASAGSSRGLVEPKHARRTPTGALQLRCGGQCRPSFPRARDLALGMRA